LTTLVANLPEARFAPIADDLIAALYARDPHAKVAILRDVARRVDPALSQLLELVAVTESLDASKNALGAHW
jgi:hypothetical protein